MRHRVTTLVTGLSLLTLVAAGCGGSSGSGGESTGTLTVWIMDGTNANQKSYFKSVNTAFEKKHPDVTVDVQFVPWTAAHQKFVTATAGGAGPDVAEMGTTWNPEFAATGGLADLTGEVKQWGRADKQVSGLMDTVTYQDKYYGVPWYAGVRSILYRKDWFKQLDLEEPETWEQFVKVGKKIQQAKPDVYPFPVAGDYQYALYPFIWNADGSIAENQGGTWTSTIDESAARKGVDFYTSLLTEHGFSPKSSTSWDATHVVKNFQLGKLAMAPAGEWEITTILENQPELKGKLGSFPFPTPEAGQPSRSFLGGSNLVSFANSEKKDLAWEYINFLTKPKWQQKWAVDTGFFPANTDLLDTSSYDKPVMQAFLKQFKNGRNVPNAPKWGAVEGASIIPSMTQSILTGKKSVEAATSSAAKSIEKQLNSGG